MPENNWSNEFPAEIITCDKKGIVLEMNLHAVAIFEQKSGDLLGKNLLNCHPFKARRKLETMLSTLQSNCYFNTEGGETRFFFQSPWFNNGMYQGFSEISFEAPEIIPHLIGE